MRSGRGMAGILAAALLAVPILLYARIPVRSSGPLFPVPLVPVASMQPTPIVADLNRDGSQDVVLVGSFGGGVLVLLGRGDGTFGSGQEVDAGQNPRSIVAEDFDGDGILDLAVARGARVVCSIFYGCQEIEGDVAVLPGRGDGTFGAPVAHDAGPDPALLAAGDFTGDGRGDLIVTSRQRPRCDETSCTTPEPGPLVFLPGNGDGSFGAGQSYVEGDEARGLAVADLNGDSAMDLVATYANQFVCGPTECTIPTPVVPFLGTAGGLLPLQQLDYSGPPFLPLIGDFDGDARADLVVGGSYYTGRGDGTFDPPSLLGVTPAESQLAAIDVNDDGHLDLVAARSFWSEVAVFLGDGHGGFAPPMIFGTATAASDLAYGDFNGDGRIDLLLGRGPVVGGTDPNGPRAFLAILFGTGDGRFLAPARYITGGGPSPLALADFDGDGREDVATATTQGLECDAIGCHEVPAGVTILKGRRDGSLAPALRSEVGGRATAIVAGDFDGDHHTDLALSLGVTDDPRDGIGTPPPGDVALLLGNGDGTFHTPRYLQAVPCPSSMIGGDFNGDGKWDLVAVGTYATCPLPGNLLPSGGAAVLLGRGDGGFGAPRSFDVGEFPARVAAARFDGDRTLDLVVTHLNLSLEDPVPGRPTAPVSILLGRGDGAFEPRADLDIEGEPFAIAVGDLDGDRRVDLALGAGSSVAILKGNGVGGFGPAAFYGADGVSSSLTIDDFDADGTPDIAAASAGNVTLLPGRGNGTLGPLERFGAGGPPVAVGGIDLDGDRLEDIVVTTCATAPSGGIGPGVGGHYGNPICAGRTGVSVLLNRLVRPCDDHCGGAAGRSDTASGRPDAVRGRAGGR